MPECRIRTIDSSNRVLLPFDLCESSAWISGVGPVEGWLLMQTYRRLRLLSRQDVESDEEIRSLRQKVKTIPEVKKSGPLDFDDAAMVVLADRLVERSIVRSQSGWRLTLPKSIIELWGINPSTNNVGVLVSDGYIEIWSMEELAEAYSAPLRRLL